MIPVEVALADERQVRGERMRDVPRERGDAEASADVGRVDHDVTAAAKTVSHGDEHTGQLG